MWKIALLLLAIVVGYMLVSSRGQQEIAVKGEQREQQIMEKQKQFRDQTKDLAPQMQKDLENRMDPVDSAAD